MADLVPIREQVYGDPRPKECFDRFHRRSRTREPDWVYELARVSTSLYAYTFLRARAIDAGNIPGSGAVILAPNHCSFMDHFLMACHLRRKVRFMAKSQLFKPPMQFVFSHAGVFPVRRGARDEEAFVTAEAILHRGGAVAMYCEGGRSRTGDVGERAKRGIGRLALETGAPVVPIAIHGSARVRNWKRLQFPEVTVRYGEAICWPRTRSPTREQQQAVAEAILAEIRDLHAELAERRRRRNGRGAGRAGDVFAIGERMTGSGPDSVRAGDEARRNRRLRG